MVLQLGRSHFLLTAGHGLAGYEQHFQSKDGLKFQIGHLSPLNPRSRIARRYRTRDVVFLGLAADEANQVGSDIVQAEEDRLASISQTLEDFFAADFGWWRGARAVMAMTPTQLLQRLVQQ